MSAEISGNENPLLLALVHVAARLNCRPAIPPHAFLKFPEVSSLERAGQESDQ